MRSAPGAALRIAILLVGSSLGWAEEPPPPGYPPPPVQPPATPSPGSPPPLYPPSYPAPYPPPANPYLVAPPPPPVVYRAPRPAPPPPWIRPRSVRGSFGASGFGTVVAGQRGGVEYLSHGGGLSLWGSVELGRVLGFEARLTSSFHNPVNDCFAGVFYVWCEASYLLVQSFGIDMKLHVPTGARVVPFVTVGPMVAWIGRQAALADAVGGGFEAGGGLDVWIARNLTIGFEVLYRGLLMSDYATYTGTDTYLSLVQIGGTIAAHFQ